MTIGQKIVQLRTAADISQEQLSETLGVSRQSVSKWERGESVPDVFVLKQIADMSGVTVDYLLNVHDPDEVPEPEVKEHRYSRRFISLTVLAGIWALAVLLFVILWLAGVISWIVFVCAIPVSLITMLVLNSIWGNRWNNLYIISALAWSIIALIYLSALEQNWWQLFLLGVPAQIIIIFAFSIKKRPKSQK